MEEIIASISRIITDEETSLEPVRPTPGEKSEILELTEVVDEDGSVRRVAPEAGNSDGRPTRSSAGADPAAANATAGSGPGAVPPEAEVEPRLELGRERILSSATSSSGIGRALGMQLARKGAAVGLLARRAEVLKQVAESIESCGGRALALPADVTDAAAVREAVRELLRPLLQTWLDENLPRLVERLVREEIARVVGEAGLR